ncbi:MAG: DUF167 domain-containing protein [Candidatus Pacebacteria bacterium]|nr:DUF167 domain-containing protein [Candidatus Paceibacterota bacterium]
MYIKVKVNAGAKKESFEKVSDDHFKVSVKEKARMNMANRRVTALLADHFNISEKQVRLINGHHSSSKIFDIKE